MYLIMYSSCTVKHIYLFACVFVCVCVIVCMCVYMCVFVCMFVFVQFITSK